jgi:hypothetical protein
VGRLALLVGLALCIGPARALDVAVLEARYEQGRYRVMLDAVVDAPAENVRSVLNDFAGYAQLDRRIRSSQVIGGQAGQVLLKTRVHACAGWFCRDVNRVERVTLSDDALVAEVVPERSDFRGGDTRTEWGAVNGGTRIRYQARFTPDFWIPAILGRALVLRSLRESTLELFSNVEERARGL